jgi:ABC-type Na+ transport system ATPase subunit NatA
MPLTTVPLFADLFSTLRDSADSLGVGAYGISLTTLEQVFISLAREAKLEHHEDLDDHAGDWQYWARKHLTDAWYAACAAVVTPATHPTPVPSADIEMNGKATEIGRSDPDAPESAEMAAPAAVEAANEKNPGSYQGVAADAAAGPLAHQRDNASAGTVTAPPASAETGSADGVSKGTPIIQFVELYRKRYIIASRDMKGLFFQLIFPALQIALIMLILTVSVNPAGHTITLNANMFSKNAQVTPVVPIAGTEKNYDLYCENLNPYTMDLVNVTAANSSALSDILLEPTQYIPDRLGAYVFGDVLSIDLSLNWEWVKNNLNGLGDTIDTIPGAEDAINNFLADNLPPLELNVTDFVGPTNVNFNQLNDFLETTFNVSLPGIFNLTSFNVTPTGTASVGSVTYNAADNTFLLSDVTVEINGNTVDLGDTTVSADQFALFLPDGIGLYEFALPSKYTVMHNTTSPHGIAAFYSELVATAFQECSPTAAAKTQYLVKNHPLPITTQQALEIKVVLALLTSIFILVPLCYIPASFVSFLVKERVSKSKHLQIVSSVSPYLYWTATFSWDVTLFLSLVGFILAAFFCFGSAADVFIHSQESTLALLCLLVTYGLGAIPLSYLYSMMFDNFSTAQISIMVINFMTGFVMVLAYYIMINVPSTKEVGYQLVHFFRFFPPYNVGEGLINLSVTYYRNTLKNRHIGYFEWEITGRNIVFMLVEGVGYFLAVLLTEFSLLQRLGHWLEGNRVSLIPPPPPPRLGVDQDVAEEQERVKHIPIVDLARASAQSSGAEMAALVGESTDPEDAPPGTASQPARALLIRGLLKTYPPTLLGGTPKHAVRGVSLACSDGERFGLLGINGAGKTTILGILTGDLQPTAGEVYIGGKPLSDPGTMSMIGYCPQVDPLLDLMNAYETLWFFGRIRGIPKAVLERRVNDLIEQVGLERFAHKPCGTYSGGNKRKLSLAVALIGDPRVLFLDEVTYFYDCALFFPIYSAHF